MGRRLALDLDPLDDHVPPRAVARTGRGGRDRVDDLAAAVVGHLTEDGVLAVEPARLADRDEELRPVGTGTGVRHGQQVWPVELQVGVDLVLELVSGTAPTRTGRVAALDHEAADHPVEDGAVVERPLPGGSGARVLVFLRALGEPDEVAYRLRRVVVEQLDPDRSGVRVQYGDSHARAPHF